MSLRLPRSRALALTAATALAWGLALTASTDGGDAATRNYVQVSAREFYFGLSKTKVKPGSTTFELVNFGEDDHDLAVRRKGSSAVKQMDIVHPGESARMSTKLRRGTYVLWCTLADHRERGMRASLKVRR
ncbi:MAG: hypothetical protein HZB14_08840 [Actinobacteria bacterium]|nr:hypothetical protein [Actinomycetota bacterium]